MNTLRTLTAGAAAAAVLAAAVTAQGQGRRPGGRAADEAEETAAARARILVFSNDLYEAHWTGESIHVFFRNDSQRERRSLRVFTASFWAREQGYAVRRKVVSSNVETNRLPLRAAVAEMRIRVRVEDEKKSRMEGDILFGEASIAIEARARPSASEKNPIIRSSTLFPSVAGVTPAHRRQANKEIEFESLCRGVSLEIVGRDGVSRSVPYPEEVADVLEAREWTVAGLWPGWIIRGRMEDKTAAFRYWQYAGTRPAEGFGMAYIHSSSSEDQKITLLFERSTPAPAAP